jgi:hypothetical protein
VRSYRAQPLNAGACDPKTTKFVATMNGAAFRVTLISPPTYSTSAAEPLSSAIRKCTGVDAGR